MTGPAAPPDSTALAGFERNPSRSNSVPRAIVTEARMYATFSYDVTAGDRSIEELRTAIFELFQDRLAGDLLADTLICRVKNTDDYLAIARDLKKLSTDFEDQFQYVLTLHSAGAPLRSNSSLPRAKIAEIID
jgi:hypothetical protein